MRATFRSGKSNLENSLFVFFATNWVTRKERKKKRGKWRLLPLCYLPEMHKMNERKRPCFICWFREQSNTIQHDLLENGKAYLGRWRHKREVCNTHHRVKITVPLVSSLTRFHSTGSLQTNNNMSSGCVAQLVEQSLPIPEVCGLNPVIGKKILNICLLSTVYWKDENK